MRGRNFHENKKKQTVSTRNPIAKDLRTPKYKKQVVEDKTKYNRKKLKNG